MIRERGLNFWFPSEIAQEFLPAFNVLERSVQSMAGSADSKEPAPGRCRHCNLLLQSEASKARGECVRCAADRKQIGPDRPKG